MTTNGASRSACTIAPREVSIATPIFSPWKRCATAVSHAAIASGVCSSLPVSTRPGVGRLQSNVMPLIAPVEAHHRRQRYHRGRVHVCSGQGWDRRSTHASERESLIAVVCLDTSVSEDSFLRSAPPGSSGSVNSLGRMNCVVVAGWCVFRSGGYKVRQSVGCRTVASPRLGSSIRTAQPYRAKVLVNLRDAQSKGEALTGH